MHALHSQSPAKWLVLKSPQGDAEAQHWPVIAMFLYHTLFSHEAPSGEFSVYP